MLQITSLTSAYDGITALRKLSLEVAAGEMVALIGPNGAGKTTLLNTLSGIVPVQSGAVSFEGVSIAGLAPHAVARRGLLQVPEGRRVLAPLSVEENLLLGRMALGGRGRADVQDIDRVWDLFPALHERRLQEAGSLSGGQQQMLAIGRALMGQPRLLLLDEPSLGLAPIVVSQVFQVLARLNREGLTILLVEQNARRALEVASRAYVLEQGQVVHSGDSRALLHDPRIASMYLGQEQRQPVAA